jgi:hypothetical protein
MTDNKKSGKAKEKKQKLNPNAATFVPSFAKKNNLDE